MHKPVLRKLKARALIAMSEQQPSRSSPVNRLSPDDPSGKEDEEFAALGGGTRLVARKSPSVPSSPQTTAPPVDTPMIQQDIPAAQSTVHESASHNGPSTNNHAQSSSTPWSYPQQPPELYDFATYNMPPESWQADPGFQHIDPSVMPVDTMTLHYGMYGHVASMSNSSYAPVQSPLDSPTQPRSSHSDPDASWRSLFAQFNQA